MDGRVGMTMGEYVATQLALTALVILLGAVMLRRW